MEKQIHSNQTGTLFFEIIAPFLGKYREFCLLLKIHRFKKAVARSNFLMVKISKNDFLDARKTENTMKPSNKIVSLAKGEFRSNFYLEFFALKVCRKIFHKKLFSLI